MKLPPEFALPSISSTPGRPCSTCSCGSSNCASASSGDAARQPVKIEMFGRSMSGNSCSGSLSEAHGSEKADQRDRNGYRDRVADGCGDQAHDGTPRSLWQSHASRASSESDVARVMSVPPVAAERAGPTPKPCNDREYAPRLRRNRGNPRAATGRPAMGQAMRQRARARVSVPNAGSAPAASRSPVRPCRRSARRSR